MAVLLMFLLAGLAGVFIAMINRTLVQTARSAERNTLEQIAQSGMQLAEGQLRQGTLGADWRPPSGPDVNNPGWQHDPNGGFYKITLTYGGITPYSASKPFLRNPLDRYLKVDVEARFTLDNPPAPSVNSSLRETYEEGYEQGRQPNKKFLTRKITAYVPLALTDYLVWVTNLYEAGEPATLGSDVTLSSYGDTALHTVSGNPALYNDETLNATAFATAINVRLLPLYNGPIRSEGDLQLGNARIDLTTQYDTSYPSNFNVLRRDVMQVRGLLSEYADSTASARRLLVDGHTAKLDGTGAARVNCEPVASQISITLVQYLQTEENDSSMPALSAPKLDNNGLDRYRTLTRDSGNIAGYGTASATNTGLIGWGEGLYINNPQQRQSDLAALRNEWVSGSGECWDTASGVMPTYQPTEKNMAVKIILHDWTYDNASNTAVAVAAPYLELETADPCNLQKYDIANNVSTDLSQDMATNLYTLKMPYPRNGVIFAEGNVVVTGNLPAAVAYDYDENSLDDNQNPYPTDPIWSGDNRQCPGGWNAVDGSMHYYETPTNRRFDLTIVSAGTVYIEGSVLSPASRAQGRSADVYYQPYPGGHYLVDNSGEWLQSPVIRGDDYDTKVALLAADNVCLNPTRVIGSVTKPDGSPLVPTSRAPDPVRFWQVTASAVNTAIQFSMTTGGAITADARMRLLLWHGGDALSSQTATSLQMALLHRPTSMEAMVSHAPTRSFPFFWNPNAGASAVNLYFCSSASISSLYSWLYTQNFVDKMAQRKEWADKQWGGDRFNTVWLTPPDQFFGLQSWNILEAQRYTGLVSSIAPLLGFGRRNSFLFSVSDNWTDPHVGASYLLRAGDADWESAGEKFGPGVLPTGLDVEVDALIYAQRGSWFVIPGHYWHDYAGTPDPATFTPKKLPRPFPEFREPLDVRITVNGAITENTTAPAYMQKEWTEHWRGANIWYYSTAGGTPDLWDPASAGWDAQAWRWKDPASVKDNRRMGIVYTYDATLARPVCYSVDSQDPSIRYYTPRLPRLPVGPEMLFVQEASQT